MRRRILAACAVLAAASGMACSQTTQPVAWCAAVFPVTYMPADTSLRVGDTLTMRVRVNASQCYPALSAGVFWLSSDTSRVTIDSVSGLLRALAPGADTVSVRGVDGVGYGGAAISVSAP